MARDIISAKAAFGESDRAWREVGGRAVGAAKSAHLGAPPLPPLWAGAPRVPTLVWGRTRPARGDVLERRTRNTTGVIELIDIDATLMRGPVGSRGSSAHLRSVAILVAHAARHEIEVSRRGASKSLLCVRARQPLLCERPFARRARSLSRSAAVCLRPALLCSLPVAKAGATPHRRGPS